MADLNWFKSFIAVYRTGKVSSAAIERNLTQPAITQHIAALEMAAGEMLFVRTPKGMRPTERGKALYVQVVESLERLERVSKNLRRDQNELPLLRLGAPPEFFYEVALAKIQPLPIRFQIQLNETKLLLEQLEAGTLDAVIATQKLNNRSLEYRRIAQEHFLLVGSKRLKPPTDPKLEVWLERQDWVSYGADLPIIRRYYQINFDRRPDIAPKLIVPDLRAVLRALEFGAGVSVLPDYLCRAALNSGSITELWKPEMAVTNDLWLAYRKTDGQRSQIQSLLEKLQG
jgi:DNA-binding transcriptional LysR family regulator